MKSKLIFFAAIMVGLLTIAGCVRLDYWAFKQRYPQAGVGAYILHGDR